MKSRCEYECKYEDWITNTMNMGKKQQKIAFSFLKKRKKEMKVRFAST